MTKTLRERFDAAEQDLADVGDLLSSHESTPQLPKGVRAQIDE